MAGSTGPKTVTDGLVLRFDASNTKSYISGSSTIYGIVPPNISASVNSNIEYIDDFGGGLGFDDGLSRLTILSSQITPLKLNEAYTWEFFIIYDKAVRNDNDTDGAGGLIDGMNGYGGLYYSNGFFVYDSGVDTPATFIRLVHDNSGSPTYTNISPFHTPIYSGSLLNVAVTYDGSKVKSYQNGIKFGSDVTVGTYSTASTQNTRIGIWGGNYNLYGDYYHISAYNRALSANELLQNYNVLKTKFI